MFKFHDLMHSLGGLHDAVPLALIWRNDERRLEIQFRDIYANQKGLPEYPGAKQGSIILDSVELIEIQLNLTVPNLRVYDWTSHDCPDGYYQTTVTFSPEGKVIAKYKNGVIRTT